MTASVAARRLGGDPPHSGAAVDFATPSRSIRDSGCLSRCLLGFMSRLSQVDLKLTHHSGQSTHLMARVDQDTICVLTRWVGSRRGKNSVDGHQLRHQAAGAGLLRVTCLAAGRCIRSPLPVSPGALPGGHRPPSQQRMSASLSRIQQLAQAAPAPGGWSRRRVRRRTGGASRSSTGRRHHIGEASTVGPGTGPG